jgi:hypothetical protein
VASAPKVVPEVAVEVVLNNLREARKTFAGTEQQQVQISQAFATISSRLGKDKLEGEPLPLQQAVGVLEFVARAFEADNATHDILHKSLVSLLQHLENGGFGTFVLEHAALAQKEPLPSAQDAVSMIEQLTFDKAVRGPRARHEALRRALLAVVENLNQRDASLREVAKRLNKALDKPEDALSEQTLEGLLNEATERLVG